MKKLSIFFIAFSLVISLAAFSCNIKAQDDTENATENGNVEKKRFFDWGSGR
jgi:hypothetical protein